MNSIIGLHSVDHPVGPPIYYQALNVMRAQPYQTDDEVFDNTRPHETPRGDEELQPPPQPRHDAGNSGAQFSEEPPSYRDWIHWHVETQFVGVSEPHNHKFAPTVGAAVDEYRNERDDGSAGTSESQVQPLGPKSEEAVPCPLSSEFREHPVLQSNTKRNSGEENEPAEPQKKTKVHSLRRANDQDEAAEEESWDNDRRPVSRSREGQCDEETKRFACPFFRLDPARYQSCLNFKLRRIRDVKQHLTRRHYPSPFYCPTCYGTFPSIQALSNHVRYESCTPRSPTTVRNVDGVSQEAQEQLSKRVNRAAKPIEQYYSVWDILFVGEKRPNNPYLDDIFIETMRAIHRFWEEKAPRIIPAVLGSHSWPSHNPESMGEIMGKLFKEVETQFEQSFQSRSALANSTMSTPVLKLETFQGTRESHSTSSSGVSDESGQSLEQNSIQVVRCSSPQPIESDNTVAQTGESVFQSVLAHSEQLGEFGVCQWELDSWLNEYTLDDILALENTGDYPLAQGLEVNPSCGREE